MSDPLSVPQIAARQVELEKILQTVPLMQKQMDEAEVAAELALIKARAKAYVPQSAGGVKLLASERQDLLVLEVEAEWQAFEDAKIQAEYVRSLAKQTNAELISLQSRLKVAQQAGRAHQLVGES